MLAYEVQNTGNSDAYCEERCNRVGAAIGRIRIAVRLGVTAVVVGVVMAHGNSWESDYFVSVQLQRL